MTMIMVITDDEDRITHREQEHNQQEYNSSFQGGGSPRPD